MFRISPVSRAFRLTARIAFLSAVVHVLVACSSITIRPPPARPSTPELAETARVGAARTSLNPELGYAMGGHGISGAIAVGRWNELSARSIAITDKTGSTVFLVAVDAWSVSQGLVAKIVDILRARPGLQFVRPDQLVVSATHSHHTPGHVATSPAYNRFAQSQPGFEQSLFDDLAERVADSVALAWDSRIPAQLEMRQGNLDGLVRNRSFEAFTRNPGMKNIRDPELRPAIDQRLRSIWALAETGDVIAVFALVPIHPVAMPARTPVYHPDFFGIASRELETDLSSDRREAIVAIVNGAEGDQSPTWRWQGVPETVRLGRELARRIKDSSFESALLPNIHTANSQFRLAGATVSDLGRVAPFAMPGAAQIGGAEDGRTDLYQRFWFYEGSRRRFLRVPWHGAKKPALPVFWPVLNLVFPFPRSVPLTVARIDDSLALVTLPGEFTSRMGMSIEEHITGNTTIERVWPIGLTNAYLSYFTTPEEYDAQHYEGGSSLYGPLAGVAVRNELLELTNTDSSVEHAVRYRTGRRLNSMLDYPDIRRTNCCDSGDAVTETCPAMTLLGIPEGYEAGCASADSPRNRLQEDIRFVAPDGRTWILRVTVP